MDNLFTTFEDFVKSKNFEKIVYLIPKINKAKNLEEVLVVCHINNLLFIIKTQTVSSDYDKGGGI